MSPLRRLSLGGARAVLGAILFRSLARPELRGALAKGNWSVLDQVLSSGANFLVAFVLVRRLPAAEFGAFSIGVVVYVLTIGLARSVTGEPLIIRFAKSVTRTADAARCALGCAFLAGLVMGALCAIAAALASGPLRAALLVLAVSLPLLLVQDAARMTCFAMGRPRSAALNDGVWAIALSAALVVLVALDVRSLAPFMVAWLAPGALAGVLLVRQLHLWPRPARAGRWLRENRRLSLPLCGAYVLGVAPAYLVFVVAPAVASLAELGLARAAYVPFAVFGVFMQGVGLFLLPAAVGRDRRATWRFAQLASAGLAALALAWSALIVLLLPREAGHWLIGPVWEQTGTTRAVFGVSLAFQAAGIGPLVGMRTLQVPSRLLRVYAVTAPLVLCSGVALTWLAGAEGLAMGILVGDVSTCLLAWWQLRRVVRADIAAGSPALLAVVPMPRERAPEAGPR